MSYGYPQDPYGAGYNNPGNPGGNPYGYGIPGHPNQYGGYGPPPPPPSNGWAIGALIANIILTVTCCGVFAVPGIVTSAIAMGRFQTDPESARKLTTISWVIFGVAIVLGLVLLALVIGLGVFADSSSTGGDTPFDPGDGQGI